MLMIEKIASKTLAERLEKVLPEVILSNQNAFAKERSLFDAIRTIDNVMEYAKEGSIWIFSGYSLRR